MFVKGLGVGILIGAVLTVFLMAVIIGGSEKDD